MKVLRKRTILVAGVCVLAGFAAWYFFYPRSSDGAREGAPTQKHLMHLPERTGDPAAPKPFPKTLGETQSPTARGTLPYVVSCTGRVTVAERLQAVKLGVRVVGVIPDNALLVETDIKGLARLSADAAFASAMEYPPARKIQKRLRKALAAGQPVEITIQTLSADDREVVRAFALANGGEAVPDAPETGNAFTVKVPAELVERLTHRGDVKWMESYAPLRLLNDQAVLPQVANVTPLRDTLGYAGAGETIATFDSGLDTGFVPSLNADFTGRILKIENFGGNGRRDICGHGTHTAGTLVGTGANSDGQFRGVAPSAQLYVLAGGDGTTEGGLSFGSHAFAEIFTYNRAGYAYSIHSDSWGAESYGSYTVLGQALDEIIWNDPTFLVVMAAGNSGPNSYTVGAPATAKNCLAVGNAYNRRVYASDVKTDKYLGRIASSSSRGPCEDERIKPDLCAPGYCVVSVSSSQVDAANMLPFAANEKYCYMAGTSMATPVVAGSAAILREWLQKAGDYATAKPTAALMKAILTGGAKGVLKPNHTYGWGSLDLAESILPTNGLAVCFRDRLPFVQDTNFTFRVWTTNAAPLVAQLVWIDYPAEASAAETKALVNDLDLEVSHAGEIWYGNGGKSPDRLNTVESVRFENAPKGRYEITVRCPQIVYDHLSGGAAALYLRGAFDPSRLEGTGVILVLE